MKMLALFMKNRAEWIIAEQACYRQGATTVPMYDTLGADVVEMVLNETELQTVVCTSAEVKALVSVKPKCPSLTTIIQTNEVGHACARSSAADSGSSHLCQSSPTHAASAVGTLTTAGYQRNPFPSCGGWAQDLQFRRGGEDRG